MPLVLASEYVGSGRVKDAQRLDIIGADPGAGVEITEVVPAGEAWEIISVQFPFTTAVGGSNREPHVILTNGADVEKARCGSANTQAGSVTDKRWIFYVGGPTAAGVTYAFAPLQPGFIALPGWKFKTATINLIAGDNFGAPTFYVVKYQLG